MSKFPGWRHMTGAQRRNAKMDAIFERARQQGHTGLYSGPPRHELQIVSLRDLICCCSCGGWSFTTHAFTCDTDADLKRRAQEQFALHSCHDSYHL